MKPNKKILILGLFLTCSNIYAQISTNETPVSFGLDQKQIDDFRRSTPTITTPKLDMMMIAKEDEEDEKYDMPPRFGYPHKVNVNLNNSGVWKELSNGDKLWLLNVVCPDAVSINFLYDKFWIPDGGKLFVYSKDGSRSIGAFTNRNNKGSREDVRGFATGLVYGNDVILEYYQPKEATFNAVISIEYIVHGYRYINVGGKSLGDSGSCMVNINCEEGQNWQNEKNAVAMILVNGHRCCTGSLINTTNLSQEPFLLTANHCIEDDGDAEGNTNLDFYSFYWNYEAPGCANTSVEPTIYSTSGATILANCYYSDFALLRLSEDPCCLSGFTPFYLGWDRSGQSGSAGVGIHHPRGDVKKISTVVSQPISTGYYLYSEDLNETHWKVLWQSTTNGHGTTEKGSSGSPLLNGTHRLIGQLHGGYADCNDSISAPDWYGKFDVSWSNGYFFSTYRRLNCWLDSLNTGLQTMEGLLVIPSTKTMNSNQQLYSNIHIKNGGQLTIQSNITLMGNSQLIVESGGTLIIDGGALSNVDLTLKAGAYLHILNGGIIVIKNKFEATVGATVDIDSGQIL